MIQIDEHSKDLILKILTTHLPSATFKVFGSRAQGNARSYSDIDVLIEAPTRIDLVTLLKLKDAFEESDLNIKVDLIDRSTLDESFYKAIEPDLMDL